MEEILLNFANDLNVSLSVGDTVYFGIPVNGNITETILFGTATAIENNRRRLRVTRATGAPLPTANAFVFFEKDKGIESSGIIGYEAMVTMKNTSTKKAELFAVSSEVFESSR